MREESALLWIDLLQPSGSGMARQLENLRGSQD